MSTEQDVQVTYDRETDFYRLWLDSRMIYTCALFEGADDTLEQAQERKLRWFFDRLGFGECRHILDVGCGWGGTLHFFVKELGVPRGHGITLSKGQLEAAELRATSGLTYELVSHADFEPDDLFDGVISLGMFEHLVRPEQARAGGGRAVYRDYFERIWRWTQPGSRFGLQTVISLDLPRGGEALREIAWATSKIFPGAITPRLESVVSCAHPRWEVVEVRTRRSDYERTAAQWLSRLQSHEDEIRRRWGDSRYEEYRRYLGACVMAFREGYQSLAQLILQRREG